MKFSISKVLTSNSNTLKKSWNFIRYAPFEAVDYAKDRVGKAFKYVAWGGDFDKKGFPRSNGEKYTKLLVKKICPGIVLFCGAWLGYNFVTRPIESFHPNIRPAVELTKSFTKTVSQVPAWAEQVFKFPKIK